MTRSVWHSSKLFKQNKLAKSLSCEVKIPATLELLGSNFARQHISACGLPQGHIPSMFWKFFQELF